ncbi:ABC-type transport auxiliary lipoprotein family protein [Candidatus Magnetominusculus xianensis]|uniref:ABC transporter n=1 Tax=Candidatus Magnetominusculus xianensis TaxID=1748249 RepID=A0ABR5SIA2_9BACT|nr:ABC-type transport auxiliary lipoprotein family protein [Candidatus Magnetominusculus xianensis]KWT92062.1 ABC transporter [Candidatus Magnetominusculus xianensis]MBF0404642.1 membrane integrity-associated transporter subunit PqiC [Nitrospirota bacterium]
MNKKSLMLLIAITITVNISCATMPDTKIYSLDIHYDMTTKGELKPDIPIVIVVDSPRYLSQAFMAVRSSPYTLTIMKYSKWQSPPSTMVAEELKKALYSIGFFKDIRIAGIVKQNFYSLRIHLTRFEQFDELAASYGILSLDVDLLSPEGVNLYHNTFSKKIKLYSSDDYTALAAGLSAALKDVMDELRTATAKAITEKESKK